MSHHYHYIQVVRFYQWYRTIFYPISFLSSETISATKTRFILFPCQFPHLRAPILQPVPQPAFLRGGKLPRQVAEPVQGHPLRLFLRRQLGTGLADMSRMALSGEFLVGLVFAADLAIVPLSFHIRSLSPPPVRRRFFNFIVAHWTAVVNHAWLLSPSAPRLQL